MSKFSTRLTICRRMHRGNCWPHGEHGRGQPPRSTERLHDECRDEDHDARSPTCTTDTTDPGGSDGYTLDEQRDLTITAVDVHAADGVRRHRSSRTRAPRCTSRTSQIDAADRPRTTASDIFNGVGLHDRERLDQGRHRSTNIGRTTTRLSARTRDRRREHRRGTAPAQSVTIEGNTVTALQQERDRRARQRRCEDRREHRHGQRPIGYVAQNGIVVCGNGAVLGDVDGTRRRQTGQLRHGPTRRWSCLRDPRHGERHRQHRPGRTRLIRQRGRHRRTSAARIAGSKVSA